MNQDTIANMNEEELMKAIGEMNEDQILDLFVDSMMTEKGLNSLTEEQRIDVHKEIKDNLVYRINQAALMELPAEKLEELEKDIDAGNDMEESMNKAFKDANIDMDKVVESTMVEFREAYLKGDTEKKEEVEE